MSMGLYPSNRLALLLLSTPILYQTNSEGPLGLGRLRLAPVVLLLNLLLRLA